MRVVIDAGHGGRNIGAAVYPLVEKELNLELAKLIEDILLPNHQVWMIRRGDIAKSNSKRATDANQWKADVYISIHHNGTKYHNYDGFPVLHYPHSKIGKKLAKALAKKVSDNFPIRHRGARPGWYRGIVGKYIAVLRQTKMPAILLEAGSLDNVTDREFLLDEHRRGEFYHIIGESIKEVLDEVSIT